ncbi:MAG TPA: helix-turn-helix domain-containing protein [Candidatus Hydrogenedentes bacterium]|nr:helix-turn-helix domain-containing protein [Candidatus Hydrogenedentota bacterium]HPG69048.1 helix-turn-helix domain-containing protein [Candidatus Hydrogenedentota bacterium]
MLEAEGHCLVDADPEAVIVDDPAMAVAQAARVPVVVLTSVAAVRDALDAMRAGAFGYILLPLQPREAGMAVVRAIEWWRARAGAPTSNDELRTLAEVELEHIGRTLRQCKGNRAEAARRLGIGRNTLWRKLNETEQQARRRE